MFANSPLQKAEVEFSKNINSLATELSLRLAIERPGE
jgi:hypothetical protein